MAQRLMARADQMLSFPLVEVSKDTVSETDADGRIIVVNRTIIAPSRWCLADAARLAVVADRLARLAAGMDTEWATLGVGGFVRLLAEREGLTAEEAEEAVEEAQRYLDLLDDEPA